MELYDKVSVQLSRSLTLAYSSSFGLSSRLFSSQIRNSIYAVYGLVRIADEIVDTYEGNDKIEQLNSLESETYNAVERGYSSNPIVHAFAIAARKYHIDRSIIEPFFASMRMDTEPATYDDALYQTYIYGSAEVVGLMCLKVFCLGDAAAYSSLEAGAKALGSAYQKVNFLRDMAADYKELGRVYFPGVNYETFSEVDKQAIVKDIEADFLAAEVSLQNLPSNSRAAVMTSAVYYKRLLAKLKSTPVEVIKTRRVRISTPQKLWLLALTAIRYKVFA